MLVSNPILSYWLGWFGHCLGRSCFHIQLIWIGAKDLFCNHIGTCTPPFRCLLLGTIAAQLLSLGMRCGISEWLFICVIAHNSFCCSSAFASIHCSSICLWTCLGVSILLYTHIYIYIIYNVSSEVLLFLCPDSRPLQSLIFFLYFVQCIAASWQVDKTWV